MSLMNIHNIHSFISIYLIASCTNNTTNTNNNNQAQTGTVSCNPSESGIGFQIAIITCWVDQEMGNCQVNVGANDESEASSDFQSGDCS